MGRRKKEITVEVEDNSPLRIGFTGTRSGMSVSQLAALRALLISLTEGKVLWYAIHGDCQGADAQFHIIAKELGAEVHTHPPVDPRLRAYCDADWEEDPKPYAVRNRNIVEDSHYVIAAPAQSNNPGYGGTWQTIRFSQDADKLYRIIIPNGALVEP